MLQSKKIIACLDVSNGKVVKGKRFQNVQEVADPLDLALKYSEAGVDELVFYDITASTEKRNVFIDTIAQIAKEVNVPFTVGGGIKTIEDIQNLLDVGVDKVSINSSAIVNPLIIRDAAEKFGSERIVFAIDVKEVGKGEWSVFERGGQTDTGLDAISWAKQGEQLGAGEIVVNSIDGDGVKDGYNLELMKAMAEAVDIPVVASGGAGKMEHFHSVLTEGKADGALAASVFHYNDIDIIELKRYLAEQKPTVGTDI